MGVPWNAADDRSFYATVVTCRTFVTLPLVVQNFRSQTAGTGRYGNVEPPKRAQKRDGAFLGFGHERL